MKKSLKKLLAYTVICSSLLTTGCLNNKGQNNNINNNTNNDNNSNDNTNDNNNNNNDNNDSNDNKPNENIVVNQEELFTKYIKYTSEVITKEKYSINYKYKSYNYNEEVKFTGQREGFYDGVYIYKQDNKGVKTYISNSKDKESNYMYCTYINHPNISNESSTCLKNNKETFDKYIENGDLLTNINELTKIGLTDLSFKNHNMDYAKNLVLFKFENEIIDSPTIELKVSENYNQVLDNISLDFTIKGKAIGDREVANLNEVIEYKLIANQSGLHTIKLKVNFYDNDVNNPVKTIDSQLKVNYIFFDDIASDVFSHTYNPTKKAH